MSTSAKLEEQVMNTAKRLAQLKARAMLREMREEHRTRERERRQLFQRRLAMGDAVLQAGVGDWQPTEVVGLLLHALEDVGQSPIARIGLRKRGEAAGSISVSHRQVLDKKNNAI